MTRSATRSPGWNRRQGTFLDDLRAAGVTPEGVDFVLWTHLHVDHVGWNTRLVDGQWVPTFPNAKYVMVGSEWEFWAREQKEGRDASGCFTDSVAPVVEAGKAVMVDETFMVDEHLRFEPSHGHTPGHFLRSPHDLRGRGGVFRRPHAPRGPGGRASVVEPLLHRPEHAARTRNAFVEQFADSGVLICAAHFPRPGFIVKKDGGHRFTPAPEA